MDNLPVHWRSNPKAWMTRAIFADWVNNCFAPEVSAHLEKVGQPRKCLLILDNAPGHCDDTCLTPENAEWIRVSISFFLLTDVLQNFHLNFNFTFNCLTQFLQVLLVLIPVIRGPSVFPPSSFNFFSYSNV
jgi:hypothetical protein